MKKIICFAFAVVLALECVTAQVLNDMQVIDGRHWIYDDFATLSGELCKGTFASNTPVTAGELKLYFQAV